MRLSAHGLACIRGDRKIFSGLTFQVDSGELLAIRGPNGAGKTSLLRVVAGLLALAAGRIELSGADPEATVAEQVHYLGHRDALKASLSVLENLVFWARYLGAGGMQPVAALEAAGLATLADLPAAYLSAGQRRRLSIARLLAAHRPIWLLDEPTSALDVGAQARLSDLMRQHLARGGLILAATHGPLGLEPNGELTLGDAR
jgi:heme exporter protein A